MNQILKIPPKKGFKKIYIIFLLFSILVVLFSLVYIFAEKNIKNDEINTAKQIARSYSISKLYSNYQSVSYNAGAVSKPYIIGTLSISSINLMLPVVSEISDELLKFSVCRFYGPLDANPRKYMCSRS